MTIDAVALATLALALVTASAIVIPVWRDIRASHDRAGLAVIELSALLKAMQIALRRSNDAPNIDASGGVDLMTARMLEADIIGALDSTLADEVISAALQVQRALNNADVRANSGLLATGYVQQTVNVASAEVAKVQERLAKYAPSLPGYRRRSKA